MYTYFDCSSTFASFVQVCSERVEDEDPQQLYNDMTALQGLQLPPQPVEELKYTILYYDCVLEKDLASIVCTDVV